MREEEEVGAKATNPP